MTMKMIPIINVLKTGKVTSAKVRGKQFTLKYVYFNTKIGLQHINIGSKSVLNMEWRSLHCCCKIPFFSSECPHGLWGSYCEKYCSVNCASCTMDEGTCTACVPGYYGADCSTPCYCASGSCPKGSGSCSGKCQDGYYGSDCSTSCIDYCLSCARDTGDCIECSPGYHGSTCLPCPGNCASGKCSHHDGSCVGNCVSGHFGDFCNKTCSSNCDQQGCDKQSGRCVNCDQGFYGSRCGLECGQCSDGSCNRDNGTCSPCKARFYGRECVDNCPQNCVDISCDQNSGACIGDCASGFYLPQCNTTCPDGCTDSCDKMNGMCDSCREGYYGGKCNIGCPVNCKYNICAQFTGECNDCKAGFNGINCEYCDGCLSGICDQYSRLCKQGCTVGLHGDYCNETCPDNCQDGCDQVNADCNFCKDGFLGNQCTSECPENCKDGQCNKQSGECTNGCKEIGLYGSKCNKRCENCLNSGCSQEGTCKQGCIVNYYGANCQLSCEGCLNGTCSQEDGICTHGCSSAKCGMDCDKPCQELSGTSTCNQTTCMAECQLGTDGSVCANGM